MNPITRTESIPKVVTQPSFEAVSQTHREYDRYLKNSKIREIIVEAGSHPDVILKSCAQFVYMLCFTSPGIEYDHKDLKDNYVSEFSGILQSGPSFSPQHSCK